MASEPAAVDADTPESAAEPTCASEPSADDAPSPVSPSASVGPRLPAAVAVDAPVSAAVTVDPPLAALNKADEMDHGFVAEGVHPASAALVLFQTVHAHVPVLLGPFCRSTGVRPLSQLV